MARSIIIDGMYFHPKTMMLLIWRGPRSAIKAATRVWNVTPYLLPNHSTSTVPSASGKKSYQALNGCENQAHQLAGRILPQFTIQLSSSWVSHLLYEWNSGRMWTRSWVRVLSILASVSLWGGFSTDTGGFVLTKPDSQNFYIHCFYFIKSC